MAVSASYAPGTGGAQDPCKCVGCGEAGGLGRGVQPTNGLTGSSWGRTGAPPSAPACLGPGSAKPSSTEAS